MVEVKFAVAIESIAAKCSQAFVLGDCSWPLDSVSNTLVLGCAHIFDGTDECCLKFKRYSELQ